MLKSTLALCLTLPTSLIALTAQAQDSIYDPPTPAELEAAERELNQETPPEPESPLPPIAQPQDNEIPPGTGEEPSYETIQPTVDPDEADANAGSTLGLEGPRSYLGEEVGTGLLDDWELGIKLAAGFPHPLSVGGEVIYGKAVAIDGALGHASVGALGVDVSIRNWEVGAKYFPFGGSFFIGALYGRQTMSGSYDTNVDFVYSAARYSIPTEAQLRVDTHYWTPRLGWTARWDSGFSMGFEIGYQLPIRSNANFYTSLEDAPPETQFAAGNSQDYKDLEDKIEDVGKTIGEHSVPYVKLIEFGWFF